MKCWYKNVCKEECTSGCVRYNSMKCLFEKSGLPENKWNPIKVIAYDKDLDKFKQLAEIKSNIVRFVDSGKNLYIWSNICGNGKTSWAIKMIHSYFDKRWSIAGFECKAYFVHVPTLLTRAKSFNSKDFLSDEERNYILNADLVVWDDIASTKLSEFDHQTLLTLIDYRIRCDKSNIYTGNCDNKECYEYLGGRLFSRVWQSSERIELEEFDKRGEA